MNVDTKLIKLAEQHKASTKPKQRELLCGKADKLVRNSYPLNLNAVWQEWNTLAN